MAVLNDTPDYLICLNCESPCYIFEWEKGVPSEVCCEVCGSEESDQFLTEEDFDALADSEGAGKDG